MASDLRERFIIALSRLLGENPTEPDPCALTGVRICEQWVLNEVLATIVQEEKLELDLEKFNQLMLHCGRRIATKHFYDYFLSRANSIEEFEEAVERFRRKAMWLYGNFKFAYKRLATSSNHEFEKIIKTTEPADLMSYDNREEFKGIEPIAIEDLALLGYISRQHLDDLDMCCTTVDLLIGNIAAVDDVLTKVGCEKQKKISSVLVAYNLKFPETGSEGLEAASLTHLSAEIKGIISGIRARAETAMAVGRRNTQRYLSLPYLDVYCATSMRVEEDFNEQYRFTQEVFGHAAIRPLKLRYFDPTLSFVDDRVTKGLIECLLLRRAKVTIYNAGKEDTLGKDSELAATLAQGKQVIVFVPAGSEQLERRAKAFKIDHPLGLQVDVRHGVAYGIIVVRSSAECAKMLRKVLLRELQFSIRHEGGNYLLEESETESVLRVVSDDPYLTHAFWTYFHRTE